MPRKTIDIQFPSMGVIRRMGFRAGNAAVYPSPYAINVRLEDSLTNRLRGGSFTGSAAGTKSSPVYRDRAITYSGAMITASRVGSHSTTSLSTDVSDTMRAALFGLAEGGGTPPTVVSVIPHKDASMLCFSASQTWVLSGDPLNGSLRNVSREVGIIGANAWCKNHDTVYFMSSRGLYSVGADGNGLKAVSEDRLPEDLIGLTDTACVLDYSHAGRGVSISLTASPSWFYDVEREAFWPYMTSTASSHVLLGPFRLGRGESYGRILNIQGTMAQKSGSVTWALVTADSEEASAVNGKAAIVAALAGSSYSTYVQATGTWVADRNHISYPRVRAVAAVLWLSASSAWAFESATMEVLQSGTWR